MANGIYKTPRSGNPGGSLWTEGVCLAALLALYGIVQCHGLLVPGVGDDEARAGALAQSIISSVFSGDWRGAFPLISSEYHGALQSYFYVPFLLLLKRPEIAMRVGEIVCGALMLVETYFAARWLEGGAVAALLSAVFLLANPGFIYVSRMSASGVGLSMNVLWLGALLCLRQWVRTKRRGWLYAASVMTGAGFCVRIWFWWFWSGLLAAAILYRRELSTLVESGRRRRTWGAAAAFFY